MKKRVVASIIILLMMLSLSSCTIPVIGDFIESEDSLGKTNNTAVAIAGAMKDYLKSKKKDNASLYGVELILNSDGNGDVRLYYSEKAPEDAAYSDVLVAEVDSKTGHVSRFSKANYAKDGLSPYQLVKECDAFDAGTLPIDSEKAISLGVRSFSNDPEFHYDYVQILLSAPYGMEQYEVDFISMLNDKVYRCTVDGVSGSVLSVSSGELVKEG